MWYAQKQLPRMRDIVRWDTQRESNIFHKFTMIPTKKSPSFYKESTFLLTRFCTTDKWLSPVCRWREVGSCECGMDAIRTRSWTSFESLPSLSLSYYVYYTLQWGYPREGLREHEWIGWMVKLLFCLPYLQTLVDGRMEKEITLYSNFSLFHTFF